MEGAYEQVDARLAGLDRSIESLRAEMNGLRAETNGLRSEMNTRFDQVDRRFNNLYLLIGGSWVTIMASIMATWITLIVAS